MAAAAAAAEAEAACVATQERERWSVVGRVGRERWEGPALGLLRCFARAERALVDLAEYQKLRTRDDTDGDTEQATAEADLARLRERAAIFRERLGEASDLRESEVSEAVARELAELEAAGRARSAVLLAQMVEDWEEEWEAEWEQERRQEELAAEAAAARQLHVLQGELALHQVTPFADALFSSACARRHVNTTCYCSRWAALLRRVVLCVCSCGRRGCRRRTRPSARGRCRTPGCRPR